MGALVPLLDDLVLGAFLLLAIGLLAPSVLPWAVLGFALWIAGKIYLFRSHFRRPAVGVEAMRGRIVTARGDLLPRGPVDLDGEIWDAESTEPARSGEKLRVVEVDGLTLKVAPLGLAGPVREPTPRSRLLDLAARWRRG